jgi:hypothetical protein
MSFVTICRLIVQKIGHKAFRKEEGENHGRTHRR